MSDMLTIGGLRDVLKALPQDAEVYIDNRRPTSLGSYRGYYSDLSILRDEGRVNERTEADERGKPFSMADIPGYSTYHPGIGEVRIKANPTVADLIEALDLAEGASFEGYKGGQFLMEADTTLWVSQYGDCDSLRIERVEDLPGRVDLWTVEVPW